MRRKDRAIGQVLYTKTRQTLVFWNTAGNRLGA